jgi:hypothetical protein
MKIPKVKFQNPNKLQCTNSKFKRLAIGVIHHPKSERIKSQDPNKLQITNSKLKQ